MGAWLRATQHRFLARVRDGSVEPAAFAAWLVQDSLFVRDLLAFQARLLARAPRPAQRVLAAGALALVDELTWFEERAAEWHLSLAAEPLPATEAYGQLLAELDRAPVDDALTALWALERIYLDAWTFASPAPPPYDAFVAHWTTPEFRTYVDELERLADPSRAPVVRAVLDAEVAFWDLAG